VTRESLWCRRDINVSARHTLGRECPSRRINGICCCGCTEQQTAARMLLGLRGCSGSVESLHFGDVIAIK